MAHTPAPMQLQGLSALPEGRTWTQASRPPALPPSLPLHGKPASDVCAAQVCTPQRDTFTQLTGKGTGRGGLSARLTNPLLRGLIGQTHPNEPRTGDSKEPKTGKAAKGNS